VAEASESSRVARLAEDVNDHRLRDLFVRFVAEVGSLDNRIRLDANDVEVRVLCDGRFVCRVAPYRELFHVQVGETVVWETRVREKGGFLAALDRTIQHYLEVRSALEAG
jgi:hypothetical protein